MTNESTAALIHSITEPGEPPPDSPDEFSQLEEDYTARREETARIKQLEQNIEERKKYANRIFCLVCYWLVFVGVLVLLNGVQGCFTWIPFRLSDAVLIALITTTTINVIGVFLFVVRYLFP
jgi:uncharacterized membrane-anchored protein